MRTASKQATAAGTRRNPWPKWGREPNDGAVIIDSLEVRDPFL